MSRLARAYLSCIIAAGGLAFFDAVHYLFVHPAKPQWLILAALTLLSGRFSVKLPSIPATISVSDFFVFTSILLFGTAPGVLTVALDGLIISLWRQRGVFRAVFNMASGAFSIWIASAVLTALAGEPAASASHDSPVALLLALAAFASVYFILNSSLVAVAVAFERHESAVTVWRTNFPWLSLNYFASASVAGLLVSYNKEVDVRSLFIIVPLWLVSYLTFKTAVARVEDSNKHLSQLNKLYLSTIETLAMAIDAKDQITHGHIRRVQTYAVGLAKAIGVSDAASIKAIEAAALLHDMGKLAVPEYILNKPGKLTPAEYERMKLHASVGADILTSIEFPYPVVPIVRHHHENWDGTGYPDGLSGTEIPMGARILSVVDCFDALTSDRPYRPKLSDEEALTILTDRRGSMYDPIVVDTFTAVHRQIQPTSSEWIPSRAALQQIATASFPATLPSETAAGLEGIAASSEETLIVYELAQSLAGQTTVDDAADVLSKHLRRIVPAALITFYVVDQRSNELVATHASGDGSPLVRGLRLAIGERLSGWVAANQQPIVNSDAALDLGEIAKQTSPRLRSCLSCPLVHEKQVIGVLTLYSTLQQPFTDDHVRIIMLVAPQLARTIAGAVDFERHRADALRDSLTGLPNLDYLQQVLGTSSSLDSSMAFPISVLVIDVINLKQLNSTHGRKAGDQLISKVVTITRAALRGGDLLFRDRSDEFVIILANTDAATALQISERLVSQIGAACAVSGAGIEVKSGVVVGVATAPTDGRTLADLIQQARIRSEGEQSKQPNRPPSIH